MVRKLINFITKEEFQKVMKKEKDKKFKMAYALAFGSGLRISEIVGLKKQIHKEDGGYLLVANKKNEKTNKNKKILVCTMCQRTLSSNEIKRTKKEVWEIEPLTKEQINLQEHQIRIFGKGGKERITVTSPLLNETNIKMLPLKINYRTLERRFTNLCGEVLGKHLSFHSLRHGFANFLVNEKRIPLPMVQGFLGHSRLDTTGIYTKANPKEAVETAWEAFE